MDDLIPSLFVIAVTGLVVGLIFILVHRNKTAKEKVVKDLAAANGWVYEAVSERLSSGFRLRKGNWVIESLTTTSSKSEAAPGSSTTSSCTLWFCAQPCLPDGMVLIGPRQPEVNLGNISSFLMQAALALMIGPEAKNAEGIQQVELGSLALMGRFMVWTNREEAAKKLISQQVESALINWPNKLLPVVKFSPSGLEVSVKEARLYKEADLYALVKLGNALEDAVA